MAQFVVLEPAGTQSSEKAVFVRDGFYTLALILPVVWLLSQRLWFEAIAVLGVTILLGVAGSALGISNAVPLITLLFSLFVALEGVNWKIAKLKRQGFVEKAVIDAADLEEAEIRYFYSLEEAAKPATFLAEAPAPEWAQQAPRPTYSSFGSTIGFVGHRGEN
ncbi:DUF2628 domain-containing protein [Brucella pituitosa]|uniref:DUF2628 domain-containing protein n=1 Tax=Brucella TaxID=234 RepID=UPI0004634864|nr:MULTISPECIES: DUF2628 domain-containing protein [Brucella]PQZ48932.1 DUF2628 domain-containing protein [Ochrobactrum sp. MYb19]PRA67251.1 DUF2628 domain-containing protein [Ochrobactrum sp. MYb18]PRA77790.1 DUF2628 domain-containing protein [Brucella thiophenivorans]PRA88720.1 DUF2628 domain-containing protein [Ochrobactrum sp. MYb29]PRA92261.1 DUF2628 domain-containing protein [Ochrobactrum sp. MYb14]PRA99800.1 DUF2628 domain-containing protein [Ochrobactrum sp. MYb15]